MPNMRGYRGTPEERFWRFVSPEPNSGCWLWDGTASRLGYGAFNVTHSKPVWAHRFSYEMARGPIPEGLELDHLCRVPSCVNPDHLEAVTHAENIRRGLQPQVMRERFANQEFCKHGHSRTPENLSIIKRKGGGLRRVCKQCAETRYRRYLTNKKLSASSAALVGV